MSVVSLKCLTPCRYTTGFARIENFAAGRNALFVHVNHALDVLFDLRAGRPCPQPFSWRSRSGRTEHVDAGIWHFLMFSMFLFQP